MSNTINIAKILSTKVTENSIAHAVKRITSMDDGQLSDRIDKMTNLVKLESFRIAAKEYGMKRLARLAQLKRDICFDIENA